ncbi:MAG: ATP-binding cassette domain-containing protein, partial [Burkholderiaceae bacterium]
KPAKVSVLIVDGLRFPHDVAGSKKLFSNWSTHIQAGVTLVCGGEDSGKSTLLRLLAGELTAKEGDLSVNGISLHEQPQRYKQAIFWANPRNDTFDQLTLTAYFESQKRNYAPFDNALLADLIEGLSLTDHLHKNIYMMSAGSKRKVWLAAAFASGAAVTLIDEPFAALDMASIRFISELLADAAQHSSRAWVIADYEVPAGLLLAEVIDLDTNASNSSSGNGRPNR